MLFCVVVNMYLALYVFEFGVRAYIVAAVGVANLVKGDMIKEGCVIIDVGMNSVDDPNDKRGYHLCGDVDYNDV